jgi:P27 family predicted phage terminase small subunit
MFALLIEKPHFFDQNTAMPETIVRFPATGTIPPPPDELAEAGRELWQKVMRAYVIEETHAELLKLACLSADSAASMRAQIRAEGETVIGSTGQPTAHPLIAAEGAAQKRVATFLRQLGLFSEEKRDRPGRPPNLSRGHY